MTEVPKIITARVFRTDAEKNDSGYFEEFSIEARAAISVMTLLAKIHDLEPGFACRTSTCFKGKCGSCLVRVNGKDVFGCVTLVQPGAVVTIEPHSKFMVLRDVAVDFSRPKSVQAQAVGGNQA